MLATSTIVDIATDGAQYWWDATFGIFFEANLAYAAVAIGLLMAIVAVALWGVNRIFHSGPSRK